MSGGIFTSGVFPVGVFPIGIFPDEYENQTLIYSIIQFTEDNEMFQPPGTSLDWLVQIRDPLNNGALVTESLTGVSVYYIINKSTGVSTVESAWTPAPTISAYSNNLTGHLITVPSSIGSYTFVGGDSLIAMIDSDQGTGAILVNFRTPEATLLSNIWNYVTRTITGGSSTGGGNEIVLTAADYTLASATNQITLNGTYATTELQKIAFIYDLTIGCEIYDRSNPRKRASYITGATTDITIDTGVITYLEDAESISDTDNLLIILNT